MDSIQNLRDDLSFEALFQGVVHHCTYMTDVEARVESQLESYAHSYDTLSEHLYEFLVQRASVRVAVRRFIQEGIPFSESQSFYLRHRGILNRDGEFNSFITRHLSMKYGVTFDGVRS